MNNYLGDDNLSRQSLGITGGMNLKDNTLEAVKVGLNKNDSVAHFCSSCDWIEGENDILVCVSCVSLAILKILQNLKSLHKGKSRTISFIAEFNRNKATHEKNL